MGGCCLKLDDRLATGGGESSPRYICWPTSAMLDMVYCLLHVDVVLARQTSACIDLATIMAYTIRATAIAAKRAGRPPAYQRMAIQPPPAAMPSRTPLARRGHSSRPMPCEAKYRASPSPKQP